MPGFLKKLIPLLVLAALVAYAIVSLRRPEPGPPDLAPDQLTVRDEISILAPSPDWSALEAYHETIDRDTFARELEAVYSEGDAWKETIQIEEDHAVIATSQGGTLKLRFAPEDGPRKPVTRYWRPVAEMSTSGNFDKKPLSGVRIAIDPGHIGGEWAKMEERWYQIKNRGTEVKEGELTLATAKILRPMLEELGARVWLVRKELEPLTPRRPEDFKALAQTFSDARIRWNSEKFFYRYDEIRVRAWKVNERIRPDLVLCLHFNAESWANPRNPSFVSRNHLHLLINGTYSKGEFAKADQRLHLLKRLLQRIHPEELAISTDVANAMAAETGLPPWRYHTSNAKSVNDNEYVWARNLLANRVYTCPVVFLEPYVMNNREVYERIGAGDYEGEKVVAGRMRKSIFREYAGGVANGLASYYRRNRQK